MDIRSVIDWLQNHRGKLIASISILAIASTLLIFFTHYCFLYVAVDSSEAGSTIKTYASTDAETRKIGGSGLMVTSRNTKSILVTDSSYVKTQTVVDIPWYGFLQKRVTLEKDRNADKVAYRSTTGATCASYNPARDKLLYFSCQNPKTILEYDTPSDALWTNKKVADIYYSGNEPKPYLGGVIGIAHVEATDAADHGDIVTTTADGDPIAYQAPEDIDIAALNNAQIITDTTDPTNKNFALIDVFGNIYLGTPHEKNNVAYRKIPAPTRYNSTYNQTLCSLVANSLYCYIGRTAIGDIPDDLDLSDTADYSITTASFLDDTHTSIPVTNGVFSADATYSAHGKLFVKSYKKLFRLDLQDNTYITRELLQNVDSVAGGNSILAIQNNGVYKMDEKTSDFHQIFYSPNISPRSLYTVLDKTFIIGTTADDNTTTYAYILNDSLNTTPGKRLIDTLPLSQKVLPNVLFTDLVSNRFLVAINPPYRYIKEGQKSINSGEVASIKEDILNSLRVLDTQISEDAIQFSY